MAHSSLFSAGGKLYTDLKAFCCERRKEGGKCSTLRELNKAVILIEKYRDSILYSQKHITSQKGTNHLRPEH